jgi:hypothetical protein
LFSVIPVTAIGPPESESPQAVKVNAIAATMAAIPNTLNVFFIQTPLQLTECQLLN